MGHRLLRTMYALEYARNVPGQYDRCFSFRVWSMHAAHVTLDEDGPDSKAST